ncbi:HD domain-containing protein [Agrobacterium tumefaciens]|uniref:HD domain-containing protein n=1 Tax=Agrobacterium tumefaciens TaxID=358 RepID=UPI0006187C56|nr:ATP-binding protein [Agrobacterium tumefaciens]AKC07224.1 hypothetical protein Ach5_14480 [Agrobacterium tumefaciens]AYM67365.1 hypothetical protein AtA6_11480 [Agrobacterium tumefaciens]NIB54954.1 ATP-binding protein [Agrobacterium tumefaciens]NSZ21671.1 ATP-binding protein [Agrobacterium tumefaciens]QQE32563.1 ATP-binding protein [Agrobacterium tumefaciens]
MSSYHETGIWRAAFQSSEADTHATSVKKLITEFETVRQNAKVLVSEIAIDLPGYTVHSIEHLDALWEVASQIVGDRFQLNPVEGFVLGCSFLFHDAAMTFAAYPGGMKDIRASREWKKLWSRASSYEGEVNEASLLEVFLREQHATRASELPRVSWSSDAGQRYLIDDADIRTRFGEFVGQLAASHWWDHRKLEIEFADKVIPAPAPYPSSWSIDLLKLACVLRTADASQIDEQRAPSFLFSLRRNRMSDFSSQHWSFQNRLTQPQNRDDTLYFATLRPFPKQDANAWWLLHDTLKMVDRELRRTDDLLARRRGQNARFSARRVANIEAPENLRSSIQTDGWIPVDTAFSVSDIPRLIENLGGTQLYGNDKTAALRELVQNAMDAVRLRQFVDPSSHVPAVNLELLEQEGSVVLKIRDNGIGMSQDSIVEKLLSFGRSGWLSDDAIGEFSDNFPTKGTVSGRFGIGFFSVFMLGKCVDVKSRRFDASPDQTVILTFNDGLNSRPLLSAAGQTERMTTGGSEISVVLDFGYSGSRSVSSGGRRDFWASPKLLMDGIRNLLESCFPASDVPLHIRTPQRTVTIDGSKWADEPVEKLLNRIEAMSSAKSRGSRGERYLSLLKENDGTVVGRAGIVPERLLKRMRPGEDRLEGVIVAQGATVCTVNCRGMLLGYPTKAARDSANPIASPEALARWGTDQAKHLPSIFRDPEDQLSLAEFVAGVGGDIGDLKFCEVGGEYLNVHELREFLAGRDEIWVGFDAAIFLEGQKRKGGKRSDRSISVASGVPSLVPMSNWTLFFDGGYELRRVAIDTIAQAFSLGANVTEKMEKIDDGESVYEAQVPAWVYEDGSETSVSGSFYKRGMTLKDIDRFFIPKKDRGKDIW